jgi:hypothetical protein
MDIIWRSETALNFFSGSKNPIESHELLVAGIRRKLIK